MLKEKRQTMISVIISKIDLIGFNQQKQQEITERIESLCNEYGISITPPLFFVSTKTDQGIQELKSQLNALSKKRTQNKVIPEVFQQIRKELENKISQPI